MTFIGLGVFGGEHDFPGGRARRSRQTRRHDQLSGRGVDGRLQQLVEPCWIDAQNCLVAGDQPFAGKLDGDADSGFRGSLARSRLQHPDLAVLDGELDVLHVAIVLLEPGKDAEHLVESIRHQRFQGGILALRRDSRGLRQSLRRPDAGDHVLALRIQEELAVELFRAGGRIARERDAGR